MAYAEWKGKRHNEVATFELYFRKTPFKGKYAVFAGIDEVIQFLKNYTFSEDHIQFIKNSIPQAEPEFIQWLRDLNCNSITVHSARDGDLVFP